MGSKPKPAPIFHFHHMSCLRLLTEQSLRIRFALILATPLLSYLQ